jgi:hypothetical protein
MLAYSFRDCLERFPAWISAFESRPLYVVMKRLGRCRFDEDSDFPFFADDMKVSGSVIVAVKYQLKGG